MGAPGGSSVDTKRVQLSRKMHVEKDLERRQRRDELTNSNRLFDEQMSSRSGFGGGGGLGALPLASAVDSRRFSMSAVMQGGSIRQHHHQQQHAAATSLSAVDRRLSLDAWRKQREEEKRKREMAATLAAAYIATPVATAAVSRRASGVTAHQRNPPVASKVKAQTNATPASSNPTVEQQAPANAAERPRVQLPQAATFTLQVNTHTHTRHDFTLILLVMNVNSKCPKTVCQAHRSHSDMHSKSATRSQHGFTEAVLFALCVVVVVDGGGGGSGGGGSGGKQ